MHQDTNSGNRELGSATVARQRLDIRIFFLFLLEVGGTR